MIPAPSPTPLDRRLAELRRPLVFAHRGASKAAPENSLGALRLAAELGADGVEFDVQRCRSGELVVFHDRSLGRCTGALGLVEETPLAVLRDLTLDRLGGRPGERVPTLAEWLEAAPRSLLLNLEVKSDGPEGPRLAADCARALVQSGRAGDAVLSCFHPEGLRISRRVEPAVARAALVEPERWRLVLTLALAARPAALHPHHSLVTRPRVERWHRLGLRVLTWTVDAPDEVRRCLDCGVDGIITNVPDVVRPLVDR